MKRWIAVSLIAGLLALLLPVAALATNDAAAYVLPESLREIKAEAFAGDARMKTVVIPKGVECIQSRAFAGCNDLREIIFGNQKHIEIAPDAFEGCETAQFNVYPGTDAELYALSHGFDCQLMEAGSPFLDRAIALITANGASSSMLQSGEFSAKRLIVRVNGNRLPDISAYKPTDIIRTSDGIFIVQFGSVPNTSECYNYLKNLESEGKIVIFVEPDACEEVIDDVEAASYVYSRIWDTTDPMGFDAYAAFIAANSSRRSTIAVIDSGVEKKSAYLSILRADGISLAADSTDWSIDSMRHGSVVTGIIKDCVGDANVDVLPIRVVGSNGVASVTMIAMGIQYAMEHGADVINLSLKCAENRYIRYWIDKARAMDIAVIVAAGNDSRDVSKSFPANVPGVITVSGIDSDYELSAISNYGDNISYCAPDTDVTCSAYNGTRTGTSFAAPMVAAAYALNKLDIYHDEADLKACCRKLVDAVSNRNNYGYGLMQLSKLSFIDVDQVRFSDDIPAKLPIGATTELSWTILPENASDHSATVNTDNSSVLAIDATGGKTIARAVARGTANVTVKANNSGSTKQPSDTVSIEVVQPVKSIRISVPRTRLPLGRTMNVVVQEILPANANDRGITWTIASQGGKASIAQNGTITPISVGRVRVTAVASDGYGATSNAIDIDIIDIPDPESVLLTEKHGRDISSGAIRVDPGDSLELMAAVSPEEAEQDIAWSCVADPKGAVTVDSAGKVSAVAPGTGTVTATAENGVKADLIVKVSILPTALQLSDVDTLDIGQTATLTVDYTPSNTTERGIIWSSTNPSVARVSNGVVTGVAQGTANIIAISNTNSDVTAAITVTVRQPYALNFDANGGNVSVPSKTAYSGYAVGDLPTATKDYYAFAGWYTDAFGGMQVSETTAFDTTEALTLYAHWNIHPLSDWVLPGSVPAGAQIVEQKIEDTESTASSLSGWSANGSYWKQTGSGSIEYASKPGGVRGQWPDNMADGPLSAYDNGSTKRDVSNAWAGYVYWHWMYDCGWSNGTSQRAILDYCGYGPDNGYYYQYFGAFTSTNGNYGSDLYYCNSRSIRNYIVPERTAWGDCQGATRWFRYDYYRSYYTDYQKMYKYTRTLVRYRAK